MFVSALPKDCPINIEAAKPGEAVFDYLVKPNV